MMSMKSHLISLDSDRHFDGRLPTEHVGYLMTNLPIAIRGAVSMALRNRSKSKGQQPRWLKSASDLRFTGHSGNGVSELNFELPSLDVAAEAVYAQDYLFESDRPDGELTGLDLLMNVFQEIDGAKADSNAFDPPLLRQVSKFHRFFRSSPFSSFRLHGSGAKSGNEIKVDSETIQNSIRLYDRTPKPQRARVVGQLDGMEASTQRFSLLLDGGERVSGVYPDDHADDVQRLWRKRVLVVGSAIFRASGNLLRIDAESIVNGDSAAALFSKFPIPTGAKMDSMRLRKSQGSRSGMAAIMDKWPGDETDEEIERALEQLS